MKSDLYMMRACRCLAVPPKIGMGHIAGIRELTRVLTS
jgi:hypothetical protein